MSFQTSKAVADELKRKVGLGVVQLINRLTTGPDLLTQQSGRLALPGGRPPHTTRHRHAKGPSRPARYESPSVAGNSWAVVATER
jgi:hypothetical protein